ncbi:uncharacterized protein DUF1127 [Phyllobacterium myrsinacearum]|uniref:DUF1127 domain-containing protein n=1 Tax=Phyllobacterium myrsinacearum TaxID=28101 RepID=UPI0010ED20C3|nr:DUF1127 domain-containing protein [Phyllobacterium myrsinacearum]RZS88009.1 uncharacterized protein DUF1127 [Phyllobacterium myrsinacearum]
MNVQPFQAARKHVDTPSGRIHYAGAGTGLLRVGPDTGARRTNREIRMMEADMADLISHIVAGMKRLSGPLARRWRRARTHRHINELPDHILDDIGWPEAYKNRRVKDEVHPRVKIIARKQCRNPV